MTIPSVTRRSPRRMIIVIAAAIVATLAAGIIAATATAANAATSVTADAQVESTAVYPADVPMPASVSFDRTCYTFDGDMAESCGIRLDRKTSEALFNAAKGAAIGAFNLVCVPLLTPFAGHDAAGLTCSAIAAYATSWAKLPDGQTFWIGVSGPKTAHIYLVDVDASTADSGQAATPLAG